MTELSADLGYSLLGRLAERLSYGQHTAGDAGEVASTKLLTRATSLLGVLLNLDIAWQTIEIDKPALRLDGNAARAREVLAKQIVDLAKLGERDPQRLADGALARFKL
jgi:hypothetical protein